MRNLGASPNLGCVIAAGCVSRWLAISWMATLGNSLLNFLIFMPFPLQSWQNILLLIWTRLKFSRGVWPSTRTVHAHSKLGWFSDVFVLTPGLLRPRFLPNPDTPDSTDNDSSPRPAQSCARHTYALLNNSISVLYSHLPRALITHYTAFTGYVSHTTPRFRFVTHPPNPFFAGRDNF